jgi:transcriptional regulator with XRE-family HTH domain
MTCAIRIRERRRELGLTQAEVVDRVNGHGSPLSNQSLSAVENGRRLAVGRLPDLAVALECTVSYLLGLTADPGRWQPDDLQPSDAARTPGAKPQAGAKPPGTGRAAPGPDDSPDRATPPRRSWILGPDIPEAGPPALTP